MKNGAYEANTIAKYFLYKKPMSQKKLHKMLFFSYAWYLYLHNEDSDTINNRLFAADNSLYGFQAWVHGPVFRELYPIYANYGFKEIMCMSFDENSIESDDIVFLDRILDVYGDLSADELEEISHTFKSWANARGDCDSYEPCKELLDDREIFKDIEFM